MTIDTCIIQSLFTHYMQEDPGSCTKKVRKSLSQKHIMQNKTYNVEQKYFKSCQLQNFHGRVTVFQGRVAPTIRNWPLTHLVTQCPQLGTLCAHYVHNWAHCMHLQAILVTQYVTLTGTFYDCTPFEIEKYTAHKPQLSDTNHILSHSV